MGCGGSKNDTTSDLGTGWSTFDATARPEKSALKKPQADDNDRREADQQEQQQQGDEGFSGVAPSAGAPGSSAGQVRAAKRVTFLDEGSNQPVGPQDEPVGHGSRKTSTVGQEDPLTKVDNSVPAFVSLGVVEDENENENSINSSSNNTSSSSHVEASDSSHVKGSGSSASGEGAGASGNNSKEDSSSNNIPDTIQNNSSGEVTNPLSAGGGHHHQEVDTLHETGRTTSPISPAGSGRNSPTPSHRSADSSFSEKVVSPTTPSAQKPPDDAPPPGDDGESPSNTNNSGDEKDNEKKEASSVPGDGEQNDGRVESSGSKGGPFDTSGGGSGSSMTSPSQLKSALHTEESDGGDDAKSHRRVSFSQTGSSD